MPYQNGVFSRLYRWAAVAAGGGLNDVTHADSYDDDIAQAMNQCMLRDGTSTVTADLPMGGRGLTGMRQAAMAGEAVEYAQWQNAQSARLPGEVIDFAGAAAPSLWLLCAGQAISRTTYAALYAAIGSTYGTGDGSTTFNVPDLRGRATFGLDAMGGTAQGRVTSSGSGIVGATLGAAGGSQRMQAHAHATSTTGSFVALGSGGGASQIGQYAGSSGAQLTGIGLSSLTTDTQPAAPTGNSQNMPPALMLNKIIYAGA